MNNISGYLSHDTESTLRRSMVYQQLDNASMELIVKTKILFSIAESLLVKFKQEYNWEKENRIILLMAPGAVYSPQVSMPQVFYQHARLILVVEDHDTCQAALNRSAAIKHNTSGACSKVTLGTGN